MNVAIIPARFGSKRIPKKNIKPFLGKEIIAYSIKSAIESDCFDAVFVSTDSDEISAIAKKYGAICERLRPAELSDDFVSTTEVVRYEINQLLNSGMQLDIVAEIYATAPLMKPEFIRRGLSKLLSLDSPSYVFSAVEFEFPVQRGFKITNEGCEALNPEAFASRSQDLPHIYHDAAQFYIANYQTWLEHDLCFNQMACPLILPREYVVDIDTDSDWKIAEAIAKHHME